jgi:hypothetical protein
MSSRCPPPGWTGCGCGTGSPACSVAGENRSLSAAEAAVLRALNERLDGVDIPWPVYRSAVKHGLSNALGASERAAPRIELPEHAYTWAVAWTHDAIARLRTAGYDVVGDLDELVPAGRPTGADPDAVAADDRADAATRMLGAMLVLIAQNRDAADGRGPAPSSRAVARRISERLSPHRAAARRRRG